MTNTLENYTQNIEATTPEQDREMILKEAYETQSRQTLMAKLSQAAESLYSNESYEQLDPKDIINE
jgi:hypothetical protein